MMVWVREKTIVVRSVEDSEDQCMQNLEIGVKAAMAAAIKAGLFVKSGEASSRDTSEEILRVMEKLADALVQEIDANDSLMPGTEEALDAYVKLFPSAAPTSGEGAAAGEEA